MPDCPICGGSIKWYDSKAFVDSEKVGDIIIMRYRGRCPACNKKEYIWHAEYELKTSYSYGLSER